MNAFCIPTPASASPTDLVRNIWTFDVPRSHGCGSREKKSGGVRKGDYALFIGRMSNSRCLSPVLLERSSIQVTTEQGVNTSSCTLPVHSLWPLRKSWRLLTDYNKRLFVPHYRHKGPITRFETCLVSKYTTVTEPLAERHLVISAHKKILSWSPGI